MLHCRAISTPRTYDEDGFVQLGAELAPSTLGYFLISRAGADDNAHHYVEFCDQSLGRFDGLERVSLSSDRQLLTLALTFDVNGMGSEFLIACGAPIDEDSARWIESLASEI